MIPGNLISQWSSLNSKHYTEVSPGSVYKATWECPEHPLHVWEARVDSRVRGAGCPYCSGRMPTPGVNDLATVHPALASQWHEDNPVPPSKVSEQSNKRFLWRCPAHKSHVWEQRVCTRVASPGCPFCSGQRVAEGFNDLATTHPELVEEWSPKNLQPSSLVSKGHDSKVWWLCEKGHEWEATVYSRVRGSGCPFCAGQSLIVGENDLLSQYPDIASEWSQSNDKETDEVFSRGGYEALWVCEKGHTWTATVYHRTVERTGCPRCRQSSGEKELVSYIRSLGLNHVPSTRGIVPGYELDVFLPELNVAVEFNGVYWHSEAAGRTKTYHHNKYKACKTQGIQLIQIWEDDWRDKREIVEKMLAHKLGVSSQDRIGARECVVDVTVDLQESKTFLDGNHIQGWARSSYYLGLRHESELVALMCFKRRKTGEMELVRYATSRIVSGGFQKLISSADKIFSSGTKMITFADLSLSDGGLYENTGWVQDKVLSPDYQYLYKRQRNHKFGFRLKRFRSSPELQYVPGLSESQLASLNNLHRVWDSGKIRYIRYTV